MSPSYRRLQNFATNLKTLFPAELTDFPKLVRVESYKNMESKGLLDKCLFQAYLKNNFSFIGQ